MLTEEDMAPHKHDSRQESPAQHLKLESDDEDLPPLKHESPGASAEESSAKRLKLDSDDEDLPPQKHEFPGVSTENISRMRAVRARFYDSDDDDLDAGPEATPLGSTLKMPDIIKNVHGPIVIPDSPEGPAVAAAPPSHAQDNLDVPALPEPPAEAEASRSNARETIAIPSSSDESSEGTASPPRAESSAAGIKRARKAAGEIKGYTPGRTTYPKHKGPTPEACREVYDLLAKRHSDRAHDFVQRPRSRGRLWRPPAAAKSRCRWMPCSGPS